MNTIQQVRNWGETHHPWYLDPLRILLGVFLMLKGIEFASIQFNLSEILTRNVPFSAFMLVMIQHYIIFAHIVGGFMIAGGLLTRVAVAFQIPILLGALFLVNWRLMAHFGDFVSALLVLFLLICFFVVGSGPWSVDKLLERKDMQ